MPLGAEESNSPVGGREHTPCRPINGPAAVTLCSPRPSGPTPARNYVFLSVTHLPPSQVTRSLPSRGVMPPVPRPPAFLPSLALGGVWRPV